jgi:hypothetical protein
MRTGPERQACRVLRRPRSTQRRTLVVRDDEDALTRTIVELASEHGRYGYRRVTALLRNQGWHVNHTRVDHIRCREGLKVAQKQPKRGRLWLNDSACVRRRPRHLPYHCGERSDEAISGLPRLVRNDARVPPQLLRSR